MVGLKSSKVSLRLGFPRKDAVKAVTLSFGLKDTIIRSEYAAISFEATKNQNLIDWLKKHAHSFLTA